jgi:hypothetical protein
MKKAFIYAFTMLLACVTLNTYAQEQPRIPEASSTQTIIQDFGLRQNNRNLLAAKC